MNVKTIKKPGYNLHIIKNKDFKTIFVKIVFWEKLKKDELTLRNMLIHSLLFSSKNYKCQRQLKQKEEDLYGTNIGGGNYRKGTHIYSEFTISIIEEKYAEKGLVKDSLEFFFDVLLNPNVENGVFDKKSFEIVYEKIKTDIISEKESPFYHSFLEYKRLLGENKPFSFPVEGNIEDLEKITPVNLYEYYNSFFKTNNIDIFVIGNVDFDDIDRTISSLFNPTSRETVLNELCITYEKNYSEVVKDSQFNQSRLVMGGSLKSLSDYEVKYPALVYNIILGNSPNSKLFKNVREKNSYAYSISSSFNRLDGLFCVYAGISDVNYDATKREVIKEMEAMRKGKFTNQDIKNAKEVLISLLREVSDYQFAILDNYFNVLYMDSDDIDEKISNIKKITKEDIMKVANKLEIDTVFLLKEARL